MQISKNNSVSFGALLGKKEITYHHGSGIDSIKIVQHVHPFKDEFQSGKEKPISVDEIAKKDPFVKKLMEARVTCRPEVAVEKALPFTKDEFIRAKQCPKAPDVSKEALDFIDSGYNTTTITHKGYFTDKFTQ